MITTKYRRNPPKGVRVTLYAVAPNEFNLAIVYSVRGFASVKPVGEGKASRFKLVVQNNLGLTQDISYWTLGDSAISVAIGSLRPEVKG